MKRVSVIANQVLGCFTFWVAGMKFEARLRERPASSQELH